MTSTKHLLKNFARMTHEHYGNFFTNRLEAVGYLKEDVFYSQKRTQRAFKLLLDYHLNGQNEYWTYDQDSCTD